MPSVERFGPTTVGSRDGPRPRRDRDLRGSRLHARGQSGALVSGASVPGHRLVVRQLASETIDTLGVGAAKVE